MSVAKMQARNARKRDGKKGNKEIRETVSVVFFVDVVMMEV